MRINEYQKRKAEERRNRESKKPGRHYEGPLNQGVYSFGPDAGPDRDQAVDVILRHENWMYNIPTVSERARIADIRDITENIRASLRLINEAKREIHRRQV